MAGNITPGIDEVPCLHYALAALTRSTGGSGHLNLAFSDTNGYTEDNYKRSGNVLSGMFTGAMPTDILIQILELLDLSDFLTLRLASRSCYTTITHHEKILARHIVEYDIPRYARRIFPPPEPSKMNMHYVCSLRYRISVCTKMAFQMAEWITKNIFLRTTKSQRKAFSAQHERMRRRLLPRLLVIFHFLENYRQRSLDFSLKNGYELSRELYTIHPIERDIMESYDNVTLLRIQEIFPLVITCFGRQLKPPPQPSRAEPNPTKDLREKPSDGIMSAIICLGGLPQMERLWGIKDYNARRTAVDEWYYTLTKKESGQTRTKTSNQGHGTGGRQNELLPRYTSLSLNEVHRKSQIIRAPLPKSSLAKGRPMDQLPPSHPGILLRNLPRPRDIWLPTAESLLYLRGSISKPEDTKKNKLLMVDLIKEGHEPEWDSDYPCNPTIKCCLC